MLTCNISHRLLLFTDNNYDAYIVSISYLSGVNRYRFKQVLPMIGRSYLRQIILNYQKKSVIYILEDLNTKERERFDLLVDNGNKSGFTLFEVQNHFTGIEWWNKIGNFPYLIRYHVEVSQLMFGLSDNPSDSESVIYRPYKALVPNSEGIGKQYPILFYNTKIKEDDGCICYNIKSGNCKSGIQYLSTG